MRAGSTVAGSVGGYLGSGFQRLRRYALRGAETAAWVGLLFAGSALALTLLAEEHFSLRTLLIAGLFGTGGAIGFLTMWLLWTLLIRRSGPLPAIVFAVLATGVAVGCAFAAHLALFIQYYTEWHASAFTVVWAHQMFYTTAQLLMIFLTRGFLYLLPLGWIVPLAAAYQLRRAYRSAPDAAFTAD